MFLFFRCCSNTGLAGSLFLFAEQKQKRPFFLPQRTCMYVCVCVCVGIKEKSESADSLFSISCETLTRLLVASFSHTVLACARFTVTFAIPCTHNALPGVCVCVCIVCVYTTDNFPLKSKFFSYLYAPSRIFMIIFPGMAWYHPCVYLFGILRKKRKILCC